MKLFLFLIMLLTQTILATNWYIDAVNGSNSNDGLTEATALRDIYNTGGGDYTAIWTLVSAGDKVFIKNGTYTIPDLSAQNIFNISKTIPFDNPVTWIGDGNSVIIQSAYSCYIPNRNQVFTNIQFVSTRYAASFSFYSRTDTAPKDTMNFKCRVVVYNCSFKVDFDVVFGLGTAVSVYTDDTKGVEHIIYGNTFIGNTALRKPAVSFYFNISGANTNSCLGSGVVFQNNTLYFDSTKMNNAYEPNAIQILAQLGTNADYKIINNVLIGGVTSTGRHGSIIYSNKYINLLPNYVEKNNLFYNPRTPNIDLASIAIQNYNLGYYPINTSSRVGPPNFDNTSSFELKNSSEALYMREIPGAQLPNFINIK